MTDKELEALLEKFLKHDFSAGTEAFSDTLLQRCLEALDENGTELTDEDLEMLAAAGNVTALGRKSAELG